MALPCRSVAAFAAASAWALAVAKAQSPGTPFRAARDPATARAAVEADLREAEAVFAKALAATGVEAVCKKWQQRGTMTPTVYWPEMAKDRPLMDRLAAGRRACARASGTLDLEEVDRRLQAGPPARALDGCQRLRVLPEVAADPALGDLVARVRQGCAEVTARERTARDLEDAARLVGEIGGHLDGGRAAMAVPRCDSEGKRLLALPHVAADELGRTLAERCARAPIQAATEERAAAEQARLAAAQAKAAQAEALARLEKEVKARLGDAALAARCDAPESTWAEWEKEPRQARRLKPLRLACDRARDRAAAAARKGCVGEVVAAAGAPDPRAAVRRATDPACGAEALAALVAAWRSEPAAACRRLEALRSSRSLDQVRSIPGAGDLIDACYARLREHLAAAAPHVYARAMTRRVMKALGVDVERPEDANLPRLPMPLDTGEKVFFDGRLDNLCAYDGGAGRDHLIPVGGQYAGPGTYFAKLDCHLDRLRGADQLAEQVRKEVRSEATYVVGGDGRLQPATKITTYDRKYQTNVAMYHFRTTLRVDVSYQSRVPGVTDSFQITIRTPWSEGTPSPELRYAYNVHLAKTADGEIARAILDGHRERRAAERDAHLHTAQRTFDGSRDPLARENAAVELLMVGADAPAAYRAVEEALGLLPGSELIRLR